MTKILLAVLILIFGALNPPYALIFILGMIPTLAAWLGAGRRESAAALCVAPMNAVGVLIVLLMMPEMARIGDALALLSVMLNWVLLWGPALLGWGIYLSVPQIYTSLALMRFRHQIVQLRAEQERLTKEWGEDIIHPPSAPKKQTTQEAERQPDKAA